MCVKRGGYAAGHAKLASLVPCHVIALLAVDWVIPEVLCVKQGGYGGRARYILKDVLKFLPLYGWYLGYVRMLLCC